VLRRGATIVVVGDHDRLAAARAAVLRNGELPELLRQRKAPEFYTPEGLADSLAYTIQLSDAALAPDRLAEGGVHYAIQFKAMSGRSSLDESTVPLGTSKYHGLPHLPDGFDWRADQFFLAQFNLAQLHPYDLPGAFPDSGMLYLFYGWAGGVSVHHHQGPVDALRVAPYPDRGRPSSDVHRMMRTAEVIQFAPRAVFYLDGDGYDVSRAVDMLPDSLRTEVAEILQAPVTGYDTDARIFGEPLCWQGDYDEIVYARGGQLEQDENAIPVFGESGVLLFQDQLGDGNIHVWAEPEAVRRHDYAGCWATYSGT